jgi:hypothetical protein
MSKPTRRKHRFTDDEKACIRHALTHLHANHILDGTWGGWYYGNRDHFIKRHERALSVLSAFLTLDDDATNKHHD